MLFQLTSSVIENSTVKIQQNNQCYYFKQTEPPAVVC